MKHRIRFALILLPVLLLTGLCSCGGGGTVKYRVTFSVGGVEHTVTVRAGETPAFDGDTARENDGEYSYTFTGWDRPLAPATADTTYTACYDKTELVRYHVTFSVDGEETVVSAVAGETPVFPGTPVKKSDILHTYTFDSWDKAPVPATGDAVYTAVFTAADRYYRIVFSVDGGETILSTRAGETPVFSGNTEKAADSDNTYRFLGWSSTPAAATEDCTYIAVYETRPIVGASLPSAPNGAKAIVTMTFDDGIYDTALWLNGMFAKYGLSGSCMMIIGKNVATTYQKENEQAALWRALFAEGTLEPQSHSMTHMILSDDKWASANSPNTIYNNTQKNYAIELLDSRTLINRYFPGFNCISFASSNNTMSTYSFATNTEGVLLTDADGNYIKVPDGGASAYAANIYYAMRCGSRGLQSIDPACDGSDGSWNRLQMRGFKDAKNTLANAKAWVDSALETGNWLITISHAIGDTGDMTRENAEALFAYMSGFVKSGDLWCAPLSTATKYIRERQNSRVSVERNGDGLRLSLTIDRNTADGLYLNDNIFNLPLTVRVTVPEGWESVSYQSGGTAVTVPVTTEDGERFALVHVTPGADDATITLDLTK